MRRGRCTSFRIALGLATFLLVAAQAPRLSAQEMWAALRNYSNLTFNKYSGDWNGFAVTLIPYNETQTTGEWHIKVLWRSTPSWVHPPVLLDAMPEGEFLVIEVPQYEGSETWKLLEKDGTLTAYDVARRNVYKLKRRR
jgi:hypothetical protein